MRLRLQRRPAAAEAQLTQSAVVPRSQVRCLRCWQQHHAAWLPVLIHGYPLIAWCKYVLLLLLLSRCLVQSALTLASEPLLTYPATPPRLHSTARPMSRCAWPVGAMFLRLRLSGGLVNTPATPQVWSGTKEGFFCAGKEAREARGIETC